MYNAKTSFIVIQLCKQLTESISNNSSQLTNNNNNNDRLTAFDPGQPG